MAEKNPRELVVEELEKTVGNWSVVTAYLEHQVDLQGKIIKEMAKLIEPSPELTKLLEINDSILANSSIDFENLESPLEAYKVPNVITTKGVIRSVQKKYLSKVLG